MWRLSGADSACKGGVLFVDVQGVPVFLGQPKPVWHIISASQVAVHSSVLAAHLSGIIRIG
jgi:hypothetical protein